jgi:HlyD family secretion protein
LQNETAKAEAELAVKLSDLELEMYMDEEAGTFQLSVEEIERKIDDTKNTTLEARAALELARVDRSGMKELFKLGYRGKSDLDQSRLKLLDAEARLATSMNTMKTHQGNRQKLTVYEFQMQKLQLEGAVETAKRSLQQVLNDNDSLAEQSLAAKQEAERTEAKELERLTRLETQLERCKIFAPHSGMVVYVRERRGGSEIAEGATVRERQRILTLPDLSLMKVKTQVHEAVLDQVRPGMPATVRVDAFADKTFAAIVEKVGVVPSSDGGWFSASSVKTYDTEVKLLGEVENLKPGMTAVVNIHVDQVPDVLAVPVQAVVQVDRETWCYVESGSGVERRDVTIGRSNEKFVHIREGLSEGDRVVLNPMDIFDEQQEGQGSEISPEAGVPELSESQEEAAKKAAESRTGPRTGPAVGGPGGQNRRFGPPGGGPTGPNRMGAGAGQRPSGSGEAGGRRSGAPGGGAPSAQGGRGAGPSREGLPRGAGARGEGRAPGGGMRRGPGGPDGEQARPPRAGPGGGQRARGSGGEGPSRPRPQGEGRPATDSGGGSASPDA